MKRIVATLAAQISVVFGLVPSALAWPLKLPGGVCIPGMECTPYYEQPRSPYADIPNSLQVCRSNQIAKMKEYQPPGVPDYSSNSQDDPATIWNNTFHKVENDQAREQAWEIMRVKPTSDEGYFVRARAYQVLAKSCKDSGIYKFAIADFQRSVDRNYKKDLSLQGIGHCYLALKDFQNAIASYQKAIDLNPSASPFYDDLGWAYQGTNQDVKALSAYLKCFTIKVGGKNCKDWIYRLAPNQSSGGSRGWDWSDEFISTLAKQPVTPADYYTRGLSYRRFAAGARFKKSVFFNKAIDDYNVAIKGGYKRAEAYEGIGDSYYLGLEEFKNSILNYTQAIALNPNRPDLYLKRSQASWQGLMVGLVRGGVDTNKSSQLYYDAKKAFELAPNRQDIAFWWGLLNAPPPTAEELESRNKKIRAQAQEAQKKEWEGHENKKKCGNWAGC